MSELARIIKRDEVKNQLLELNKNIKSSKDYRDYFIEEMQERTINKVEFKEHFKNNRWIATVADDYYYSQLMAVSEANKEWCDLMWLIQIMDRVQYHTQQKELREKHNQDVMNKFLTK